MRRALLLRLAASCHHAATATKATAAVVDVTVVPMDSDDHGLPMRVTLQAGGDFVIARD